MDEFEKRLKRDAHSIRAEVSPELRARIDASLHGTKPIGTMPKKRSTPAGLWWASSLTGLAAVLLLVLIVNLSQPGPEPRQETATASRTEPPAPIDTPMIAPNLDIRTAEFTSPLEEEFENLKADIEKARENVRKDVDFTF